MTDIATRDEPGDEVAAVAPIPTGLVAWALEARQAQQIAISLAKTSFVPASLRGKPDDITAAILTGAELGLQPMASLRSMDIIQGTPALRAHAMRGLVQSRGHAVLLVKSTPTECVMQGRRAGEVDWVTVTWTIDRARQLGLTDKDQWKKQPQTMLVARATGEICRLIAADVLHAMPYAAEELDETVPAAPPATPRVTVAEITGATTQTAPAPADELLGGGDAQPGPEPDWPETAQPADTQRRGRRTTPRTEYDPDAADRLANNAEREHGAR